MIEVLKPLFGKLTSFAQKRMGFEHPPRLFLKNDPENAKLHLGRTAHYDPNKKAITIFTTGRHAKDILRSFAHELVHHAQNVRGDLTPEKLGDMGDKYAQENPHMRKMEEEAYLVGNMCFRDWEDNEKFNLQESKILKENKTMANKITKESLEDMIREILESEMSEGHCFTRDDEEEKEPVEETAVSHQDVVDAADDAVKSTKSAAMAAKKRKAAMGKSAKDPGAKYDDDLFDAPSSEDDEIAGVNESEEELKNPDKADLDDDGKLSGYEKKRAKAIEKNMEDQKESKIQTPEQENALYESRFSNRNTNLFEDLVKKWTK